ncbi:hypothetical protein D9M70_585690 [compost metagenome]
MLPAEDAQPPFGLISPGKTNGASGNPVDVIRAKDACRRHSHIGGAVVQGSQSHFPRHFTAGQIERCDRVGIDPQQSLLRLG